MTGDLLDKFLLASVVALGLATIAMILVVLGTKRIRYWRMTKRLQRWQDRSGNSIPVALHLAPLVSKAPAKQQGNAKDNAGYSSQKVPHRAARIAPGQRL